MRSISRWPFILVAMGLVIIFGLMNVINFAHGELFLLGAYTVVVVDMLGGGFWLGLALAPLVVGAMGLVIEELIIRHIYRRFLDTILATWGLSIAIKQIIIIVFGPISYHIPEVFPFTVEVVGVTYPAYRLFIMGVSVVVILFVVGLFFGTKFGLSARAVIANRPMSSCLGINTRRLDRTTFAIGAALAGLAGAVMTPLMSVDPQMGLGFLVPAFPRHPGRRGEQPGRRPGRFVDRWGHGYRDRRHLVAGHGPDPLCSAWRSSLFGCSRGGVLSHRTRQ